MADVFTDITEILKTDYEPRMADAISKKTVALDTIKRDSGIRQLSQKAFEIDADAYGLRGYSFDPDTDADLTSGAPTFDSMTISAKAIAITTFLKDIDLKVKKAGAAADLAVKVKNHIVNGMARTLNQQLCANNKGALCRLNGSPSSSTVTVDEPGTEHLYPGQTVYVGSSSYTVSTVNSETSVTFTASLSGESDDALVYSSSGASSNDMDGFAQLIVNTGTVQGVAKDTNFWSHSWIDSDAETIDTADLLKVILKANRFGPGVAYCLMGEDLWRKVGADLTALKQVVVGKGDWIDLPGGWSGLKFAAGNKAVPLMAESDMVYQAGEVYAITPEAMGLGVLDENFLPGSNGLFNKIDKRPKWEISRVLYGNFFVRNFKAIGALKSKTT